MNKVRASLDKQLFTSTLYFLIILILALRVVLHFKYYPIFPFGINISCPCFPLPPTKTSHDNIPRKWDSGSLIFMWSDLKLNTHFEGGHFSSGINLSS